MLGVLLVVLDQDGVARPKLPVLDYLLGEGQKTADELRLQSPHQGSELCFMEAHLLGILAGCLLSLGHVLLHVLEFEWLFDDVFFPLCNSTWNSLKVNVPPLWRLDFSILTLDSDNMALHCGPEGATFHRCISRCKIREF